MIIDVSHEIAAGLVTYPGLPEPEVNVVVSRAESTSRPAHSGLLRAGIPIIEHLTNLEAVPDDGAFLTALPAPIKGMASFPVRAVVVQ